jgi:hypothetical protein
MTPLFKGKPISEALPMTRDMLLRNAKQAPSGQAYAAHSCDVVAQTVDMLYIVGVYNEAEADELRRTLFMEIISIGSLTWPDCDWQMQEDDEVIGVIVTPR